MLKKNKLLMLSGVITTFTPIVLLACGSSEEVIKPSPILPTPVLTPQPVFKKSTTIYTESNKYFVETQIKDKLDLLESTLKSHVEYLTEISNHTSDEILKSAMKKLVEQYSKVSENFKNTTNLKKQIAMLDSTKDNYVENLNKINKELNNLKITILGYAKEYFSVTKNKLWVEKTESVDKKSELVDNNSETAEKTDEESENTEKTSGEDEKSTSDTSKSEPTEDMKEVEESKKTKEMEDSTEAKDSPITDESKPAETSDSTESSSESGENLTDEKTSSADSDSSTSESVVTEKVEEDKSSESTDEKSSEATSEDESSLSKSEKTPTESTKESTTTEEVKSSEESTETKVETTSGTGKIEDKQRLTDEELMNYLKDFRLLGTTFILLPTEQDTDFLPIDYFSLISNSNDAHYKLLQWGAKMNIQRISRILKPQELYKISDYSVAMIYNIIISTQQDMAIAKLMETKISNEKILESVEKVKKQYPERKTILEFPKSFTDKISEVGQKLEELKDELPLIKTKINDGDLSIPENIKNQFSRVEFFFNHLYEVYNGTNGEYSKLGVKDLFLTARKAYYKLPKEITTINEFNEFYQNMKDLDNDLGYFFRTYYFMFNEFGNLSKELIYFINLLESLKEDKYKPMLHQIFQWAIKTSYLNSEISKILSSKNAQDGEEDLMTFWRDVVKSRSLSKIVLIQSVIDNLNDVNLEEVDWK